MLAEFGLFFLILALLVALFQAAYLVPAAQKFVGPSLPAAAWLQSLLITLAFVTLMALRLDSDFSVINVIQNSNLSLPTLYKIAGTWGNHEGSMVLWVWVLAEFGAILALSSAPSPLEGEGGVGGISPQDQTSVMLKDTPLPNHPPQGGRELRRTAIAVQSAICAGFLLFILFTSSPFVRTFPPLADGEALNPLLQDMGLAMHPPLLYLGYVGFSIVFSLAVAALITGRMERDWALLAHPWILAAWSALTIGIGLGSWWAYRVLGWGGFWFWDPVENASLLPWLAGTALLHSNIVLKKRGALKQWVLLLSIVTFGMSLLGTFLTRSGVLISVHSFASDPERGMFILGYITLVMGAALLLFALRGGKMQSEERIVPLSREGVIVINNLFLLTACATVLLGTIYPMLAEWIGGVKLTVGPPYFNAIALPLLAIPLVFAGFAPFMPWKHALVKHALIEAKPALMATLAAFLLALSLLRTHIALGAVGFGLAAWLAIASVRWLKNRGGKQIPAVFLGHFGAAIVIAGITGAGLWQQEKQVQMQPGDSTDVAGFHFTYEKESEEKAPNYQAKIGEFSVSDSAGRELTRLAPEYRMYDIRKSASSTAAIDYAPAGDFYAAIGATGDDGKTAVRLYYNPMMCFIWVGCLIMAAGGISGIFAQRARS